MKRIFITIVFFIAILGIAKSANRFGWARTTSGNVITQDEWACLIEQYGAFQPTLQVYGPNGKINQNAITSLKNWCTVNRIGLVSAIYSPCFYNCNHRVTPADQILSIGIMTNATSWAKVFGPNFTTPSQNPYNYLWWVYHDAAWIRNGRNNGNTSQWKSFGGWSQPLIHEYVAGQTNQKCTNKTFAYST
uniref:Uncharacterized protein n=1 Tax=Acrobeloides nanus TaxID=290746 RepID=A0A914ELQ2_9BILA